MMTYSTERSKALYERSLAVLIEGSSSPSRGPANYGDYPLYVERGAGSRIFDVDGNMYVDWMMAYGALPLGHAHPVVVEAVAKAASEGTLFAAATQVEVEVAELIQRIVPSAERVRFANTGTEAAMAAIRLARGVTGRPKFIKFEGHYHGWYDDFLVNSHPHPKNSLGHRHDPIKIADSSGLNRHALDDTVLVPWNDFPAVERAIETHRGQIAAIISEGIMANMGVIPPQPSFLGDLMTLAHAHGILFILDETVTGFRVAAGGCQELFSIVPDLTVLGKAVGSGFPVAALAGKAEIMDGLAWGGVLHYGTQNASRIGMVAARASLEQLVDDGGTYFTQVRDVGDKLCYGLREVFAGAGVPAIVQQVGPMFQIMFTDREAVTDYREFCAHVDRDRYRAFARALFAHGVYMTPSAALHSVACSAHTDDDIALTLEAAEKVIADG